MEPIYVVLIAAACAVVFAIIGFAAGIQRRKRKAEAAIGSAEDEAKRILNEAIKTAEAKKRESILEAKEEIHSLRSESDRELRERRAEVQRQERRMQQKEESLDKKMENYEAKEERLSQKAKEIDAKIEEAEQLKTAQRDILTKISGFTPEQAKAYLLKDVESELAHDKAVKIMEYEQQLKEEMDQRARELVSQAIQRCAADHSSETTVSFPQKTMSVERFTQHSLETVTDENYDGDLIFSCSDESVATVSQDGLLTAVGVGSGRCSV